MTVRQIILKVPEIFTCFVLIDGTRTYSPTFSNTLLDRGLVDWLKVGSLE